MNILVACEFSGTVRQAFSNKGHYAVSVDLLDTEKPDGNHYASPGEDRWKVRSSTFEGIAEAMANQWNF